MAFPIPWTMWDIDYADELLAMCVTLTNRKKRNTSQLISIQVVSYEPRILSCTTVYRCPTYTPHITIYCWNNLLRYFDVFPRKRSFSKYTDCVRSFPHELILEKANHFFLTGWNRQQTRPTTSKMIRPHPHRLRGGKEAAGKRSMVGPIQNNDYNARASIIIFYARRMSSIWMEEHKNTYADSRAWRALASKRNMCEKETPAEQQAREVSDVNLHQLELIGIVDRKLHALPSRYRVLWAANWIRRQLLPSSFDRQWWRC